MRKLFIAIIILALTTNVMGQTKVMVKVGNKVFTATLLDNETARDFLTRLPVTLTMNDVNGNEKYATFNKSFTGTNKVAGDIKAGDLKIWSGNGLVLFYESFSSSYSYYDLGSIDDATGLRETLGSGSVSVTFEAQTTDITNVSCTDDLTNIYNLDGTLAARNISLKDAHKTLRPGLYIADGRKIAIK